MSDPTTPYEQARDEYRRLLDEYGRALAENAATVVGLFDQARAVWNRLRLLAPADSTEANVSEEMHLVVTFSHAVGAGHAVEAQRIYKLMSDQQRQEVDAADLQKPGL